MAGRSLIAPTLASWDQPTTWRLDAACRGLPAEQFHPERGESTAEARAVCARCVVRAQCLDFALGTGQHHGIWGGTSERERRRLRRQRQTEGGLGVAS